MTGRSALACLVSGYAGSRSVTVQNRAIPSIALAIPSIRLKPIPERGFIAEKSPEAMTPPIRIQHNVYLVPQPTRVTCWMATASMLLGYSINRARTVRLRRGGLVARERNIRRFAEAYGLRILPGQCWAPEGLVSLLSRGPAGVFGNVPTGHCFVLSGIETDGTWEGTFLTVHDPWPVNKGTIRRMIPYVKWMRSFPNSMRWVLQL